MRSIQLPTSSKWWRAFPTEWNADKAFAGLTNAMQANPDIDFLFARSDFMLPLIQQVLDAARQVASDGPCEPCAASAAFDGDSGAYAALLSKHLDADGVQDLFFEAKASVDLILAMGKGEKPSEDIPGSRLRHHAGQFDGSPRPHVGLRAMEEEKRLTASL